MIDLGIPKTRVRPGSGTVLRLPDNVRRVGRAQQALGPYTAASVGQSTNAEDALTDLLTDLRHWADANNVDFIHHLALSAIHHRTEK